MIQICTACTYEKPVHEFIAGNGRHCKTCADCREKGARAQRKAAPPRIKARPQPKADPNACDECGGVLTRNRTTKLDGRLLCHPCWSKVWA